MDHRGHCPPRHEHNARQIEGHHTNIRKHNYSAQRSSHTDWNRCVTTITSYRPPQTYWSLHTKKCSGKKRAHQPPERLDDRQYLVGHREHCTPRNEYIANQNARHHEKNEADHTQDKEYNQDKGHCTKERISKDTTQKGQRTPCNLLQF